MNMIEQIKVDREAGTPGPWADGQEGNLRVYGPDARGEHSGLIFDLETGRASKGRPNARRIARVPDMEAALLSIFETLDILDGSVNVERRGAVHLIRQRLEAAIGAK